MQKIIQANISGYLGKATSLFAIYDSDSGVLLISKQAKDFQKRTGEDCILISNIPRTDNDFYIDESMILESIQAYYRLKNGFTEDNKTPLLVISNKVGGADPQSCIEINGVNGTGMDYRIAPDIKNVQIAVLTMCLYVTRLEIVDDMFDMFETLNDPTLYTRAFTI